MSTEDVSRCFFACKYYLYVIDGINLTWRANLPRDSRRDHFLALIVRADVQMNVFHWHLVKNFGPFMSNIENFG